MKTLAAFRINIGRAVLWLFMLPMSRSQAHAFIDGAAARSSKEGKALLEQERKRVDALLPLK